MKNMRYFMILFLITSSVSLFAKIADPEDFSLEGGSKEVEQARFINDSVVNMSDQNILVQIQFHKVFNISLTQARADLKKYASYKQVSRVVNYVLAPKKAIKMYEIFLKSNPLSDKSYWMPVGVNISAPVELLSKSGEVQQKLSIHLDVGVYTIIDGVVQSKKYVVNMVNNELQVETENTLKP